MDFQVTRGGDVDTDGVHEIIEFAWLIIDVHAKVVTESKQTYVKPECHPVLSEGCQALTGISQETIESGGKLQDCVSEFNDYVYKNITSQNKDFCIVTDGDVHLKRWLRSDAKRKNIKLAAHYARFVDLRSEFINFYPNFAGATNAISIADRLTVYIPEEVDGGLKMCEVIGQVVIKMLIAGAPMQKTITIPDDYDPTVDPLYAPGGAKYMEISRALGSREPALSMIARVRGLPYSAATSDIEEFFRGCAILKDGINFVLSHGGRPAGEAFVTFETENDCRRALMRDRDLMNKRYVEVYPSGEDEKHVAITNAESYSVDNSSSFGDPSTSYKGVVKLRGLPYSITSDEIRNFFGHLTIADDGITICLSRDGRNNGEAFVEFTEEYLVDEAVKRDRQMIGNRYVEVFRSSKADIEGYHKEKESGHPSQRYTLSANGEFFLRMRGLPFSIREPQLMEFFQKADVAPIGICLVYNSRDYPTGEAFVEFADGQDLMKGLTLHRENIGHRYVELFRTTRSAAMYALRMPVYPPVCQHVSYLAPLPAPVPNLSCPLAPPPHPLLAPTPSWFTLPSPLPECSCSHPDSARSQTMQHMPQAMAMHPYNPMGMGGMDPSGMQGMVGMDMSGMGMGMGMPAMNGYMTGMASTAGCVKIRGLPYRATVNDIADFFNGFSFNRETIQISMGYDGRSTGEGWITFDSPEEASRAVAMRNGQNIGNRYVELYLV
eukprot:681800-Hanusia_phi.AAC.1